MKGLLISGSKNYRVWNELSGKVIQNKTVLLQDLGDIHPFNPTVVCNCDTLVVDRCDKNFVYYWLGNRFHDIKETFPNIKTIYLGSHPCEPITLQKLHMLSNTNTYLREDYYMRYKERWLGNNTGNGVVMITRDDYDKFLKSLELTEYVVFKQ